jgi:hypothetical protein
MSRANTSQRKRNQSNPVDLGVFSQTSLRYIRGGLGPKWKLVGYKDTSLSSNGGIGGGTYNAWYRLEITSPAWIIIAKGDPRPDYIQVSCYDINKSPIQARMIWDKDSIQTTSVTDEQLTYFPYDSHVMGTNSTLYNNFDPERLDLDNSQYFPLQKGRYLICVSSTRNEDIDYSVGLVVEFPENDVFLMRCEDTEIVDFELENTLDLSNTLNIDPLITSDITIGPDFNGFTSQLAVVQGSTTTVSIEASGTFENRATWWIGEQNLTSGLFLLDTVSGWTSGFHSHSLNDWQLAWERDHQQTDRFPAIFVPLTDEP